MSRAARVFWVMAAGTLLLQLAWVLATPTFRGPDEIDHTFRADSLVHGQLLGRDRPEDGRGVLVSVDDDLVRAARGTCLAYTYSRPDNCTPVARTADGRSSIATAAGSYNPLWYAVAGTVAAPFAGNAADLAMRAVSSIGLALLVGWAAAVTTRWDRTGWSLTGLALTVTPIVGFSAATAAPNGITIGAGLLLWCAGLALVQRPQAPPLVALLVATALLVNTHTTGTMWAAISFLALLLLRPLGWWTTWFRADLRRRGGCALAITLAVLVELGWMRWAHTNALNEQVPGVDLPGPGRLLGQQLVWLLQTVGAFPNRDQPAPIVVYALYLVPLTVLLVLGVRLADRRTRLALGVAAAFWVAVPLVLTLLSYRSEGFAWQGRYALPLFSGIVLLAACAVARHGRAARRAFVLTVVGGAVGQACSTASVALRTHERDGSFALAAHLSWGWLLVAVLALLGGLVPLLLVRTTQPRRPRAGQPTRALTTEVATA